MKVVVLVMIFGIISFTYAEITKKGSETQQLQETFPTRGNISNSYSLLEASRTAGSKVKELLARVWFGGHQEESFIGRCFGVARKLKMVIPIIMIKLAVILTVLGFLTLFTLKGLGLLTALLFISVSGIVSKIAVFFASKKEHQSWQASPQNIHLHIHQNKDGEYDVVHNSPGWDRWDREKLTDENFELYNLYKNLRRMPYSKIEYAR